MAEEKKHRILRKPSRETAKRWVDQFDFPDAVREVVLIVLSLLLAFTLDNWNDDRKERKKEIIALGELQAALQQDSADYVGNMVGYDDGVETLTKLLGQIARPVPDKDTTQAALWSLQSEIFFIVNRAPYESLRASGFDLISNDTLRLQIIQLYETTYYTLINREQKLMNRYRETYMLPIAYQIVPINDYAQNLSGAEVIAISRQLNKPSVRNYLVRFRNGQLNMYNDYQSNQITQLTLLRNIRAEVRRLKNLGWFTS